MKRKGVVAAIVLGVIVFVGILTYQVQSAPSKQRAAMHATLVNNLVIVDSTQFVSSQTPTAILQHQTIAAKLHKNLDDLEKTNKHTLTDEQAAAIQQLVNVEQKVLKTYEKNLSILTKVLTYNPSDDIGNVTRKGELTTRAKAASKGINSVLQKDIGQKLTIVADEISLSSQVHAALAAAKECFDQLAAGSMAANTCVERYDAARQALNTDLQNLWATSEFKQARYAAYALIKQLQP